MVFADQKPLRMRREKISIGLLLFTLSCAHTNAEMSGGGGPPPPGGRGGQVAPVGSGECFDLYICSSFYYIAVKCFCGYMIRSRGPCLCGGKCSFLTVWQVLRMHTMMLKFTRRPTATTRRTRRPGCTGKRWVWKRIHIL